MTSEKEGGQAFPGPMGYGFRNGMTLRDYFAAAALQGRMAAIHHSLEPDVAARVIACIVRQSYLAADQMLAKRG